MNQITIPVRNVERSVEFYRLFGLKLIVLALPHYARFECPDGISTFSLHQSNAPLSGINATWLYFEVEDVDATIRGLSNQGISILEMPEDKSWLWREARIADPDGHLLIIYHAGENRKNPPWRISEN